MTPRRKAALHKAQLASARKRRGRNIKRAAIAGGIIGTVAGLGVMGYTSRSYVAHLAAGGPKRTVPGKELDIVRVPLRMQKQRVGVGKNRKDTFIFNTNVAGKGFSQIAGIEAKHSFDAFNKKYAKQIARHKSKIRRKQWRGLYDHYRRREYWQAKPVPKSNRFTRAQAAREKKKNG